MRGSLSASRRPATAAHAPAVAGGWRPGVQSLGVRQSRGVSVSSPWGREQSVEAEEGLQTHGEAGKLTNTPDAQEDSRAEGLAAQ